MLTWWASLPIVLILLLMVAWRWGASRAGAAGYLTAVVLARVVFGLDAEGLAYAHAKALLLSLDVLLIVWAAYLLYRVADEAGAIATFGRVLPHLTADRGMQALLLGWAFASFLQGVGGFGVPVAVVAPLLVGLGFSPLAAVLIPSIGHAGAVTFGSLGSSFQALQAATGLSASVLAAPSALFLGIAGVATGWLVLWVAEGWAAVRRLALPALLMGITMAAVQALAAIAGLWNLAAFLGGLAGLGVGLLLARRYRGAAQSTTPPDGQALRIALSGYAALLVITLSIQLIPPVRQALGRWALEVPFPEIRTALGYVTPAGLGRRIPWLRHTGTILLYAALAAYALYARAGWYRPGATRRILSTTMQRMMSSTVGILTMVAMAVVMQHAGMTERLAQSLAQAVGNAYPLVAPWIGALGAFMTGSNTNSNVVFAALQQRTAELLGLSVPWILAAQTAGGALGSVIAPTKVVVGASTGGMAGREGEVMRHLLTTVGGLILLISALTVLLLSGFGL